jgi:hypothetical protein
MKAVPTIAGAFLIAITAGTTGYFIGKNQPAAAAQRAIPEAAKTTQPAARKSVLQKPDIARLREELDREKDPIARYKIATRGFEAWMNTDPQGALAWLMSQQPSERRGEILRAALAQFSESDPQGAAAWVLANLTGIEQHNSLLMTAESWAQRDGAAAAAWFATLPPSKDKDAAMETLLFTWASNDPPAAVDFIGKNPFSPELSAILRYAAYAGWAKTDPQGAVAASLASSRANQDPAQFANTLANWATMDLAASSQWLLANVKSGDERELAVKELATIFASQSPDAGLAWIDKLNPGSEKAAAVGQLVPAWSNSDPVSAAKWAAGQPADSLTSETIDVVLHNFLAKDPGGFESWRASLPAGVLKDSAAKLAASAAGP